MKGGKIMLTSFDKGEIRFQLDYYTDYSSKIFEKSEDEIDVLLIRKENKYDIIDYLLTLTINNGVKFISLIAVRGPTNNESFEQLHDKIEHAINIMNYYRVGKGNGYGE